MLTERLERPEKILVVCTHFGLAHKLAAMKEELQRREGVRMVLAVCVTDDTFQHIWYVDGADLLVVPSQFTKRKFIAYGERMGNMPRIEVVPYPVHPRLGEKLDAAQLAQKSRQLEPTSAETIHVSIPISGAAVGTEYFSTLPGPRAPLRLGQLKLVEWYSIGQIAHGASLNVTVWSYVDQLNREQLAGNADWRLPTVPELLLLLDSTRAAGIACTPPLFDPIQGNLWTRIVGLLPPPGISTLT